MPALKVLTSAKVDVAGICDWYDDQRPGLGDRFLARLEQCYDGIVANPYRYAIAFDDFREGLLKKFKYIIYYRIAGEEVIIYQVVHTSRDQEAVRRSLVGR